MKFYFITMCLSLQLSLHMCNRNESHQIILKNAHVLCLLAIEDDY